MRNYRVAYTLMWYVLREFLVTFALTLTAVTILMLLFSAYKMASDLDNFGGITPAELLMLAPFIMPHALGLALPPATMIATVMVFGRLNAELEILAAQAGGAALRKFVWPLIAFSVLISLCSLWLLDSGVRWGNSTIRTQVLKINKPEFYQSLDKPGKSMSIPQDQTHSTRINLLPYETASDGTVLRPVQLVVFQSGRVAQTVFARDHRFEVGESGTDHILKIYLTGVESYSDRIMFMDNTAFDFTLPDLGMMITLGNSRGEKSWRENYDEGIHIAKDEKRRWEFMLRRASTFGAFAASSSLLDPTSPPFTASAWYDTRQHVDAVSGTGSARERMRQDFSEVHRKLALCLLPISMIFVGIGLGLLVKKSNRMLGFLIGVVMYALFYYPLTIGAKSIANNIESESWNTLPHYLPNAVFFIFGYGLWRLYERGQTTGLPPWLAFLGYLAGVWKDIKLISFRAWKGMLWLVERIIQLPIRLFFRRTTDIYIASTFLAPLLVIIFCFAGVISALDIVDHMSEIIDGVRRAAEPAAANLPERTQLQAVRDVFVFYGIQAVDYTLDLLPLEILIAGMLCAMQLVRNQEHLILKSSGVRLQRALAPALILALIASMGVSVVRELCIPQMMLHRDYLKPQIYHRNAAPTSPALYTFDDKHMPVLFEMGQYDSVARRGRELRIYLLGEKKNGRVPIVTSDVASWDKHKQRWELFTDPEAQERKQLEQSANAIGGSKASKANKPVADTTEPPKTPRDTSDKSKKWVRGGQRWDTVGEPEVAASNNEAALPARSIQKSLQLEWEGPVTPKYIDSDRLGAKVMRLSELKKLSEFKPELMVDWYKRISEGLMGVLLLWCALPMMLSDSRRGTVMAIASSIFIGAVYLGLCMASAKFAESRISSPGMVPWLPLIPHAIFFVFGWFQFYRRMET
jgi:lipopolysaccharide export LptBFGC system permease protein LptF